MMQTLIKLVFSSEGEKPSDVLDVLYGLGFEPKKGEYDMMYNWDDGATTKDAIRLADQIHAALEGLDVSFSIETME